MNPSLPGNRELILGVGGGISAYKSCDLLRRLQENGYLVSVVPTRASLNFVGIATWEALSGRPVQHEIWNNVHEVPHVSMARKAAAIVVAPATADLIAKIASGTADDMLTNLILASSKPLILVPAMHTEMWLNSATVSNVKTLRERGVTVLEPEVGKLTSGDIGAGRYPEVATIIDSVNSVLKHNTDLRGRRVLVSAGGTREKIDPVRYIGNLSSGKQGIAVALDAASRGAQVDLVIANVPECKIDGVNVVHVGSADEMAKAMDGLFDQSDIVVMSAAVADAKPSQYSDIKISTEAYTHIDLTENVDIIAELSKRKKSQFIIGFAAQTDSEILKKAASKLESKGLDVIYANDVSGGKVFGSDETSGHIITKDGQLIEIPTTSKETLAHKLLSTAIDKLGYPND